jgi:transcription antitermination factor NusG
MKYHEQTTEERISNWLKDKDENPEGYWWCLRIFNESKLTLLEEALKRAGEPGFLETFIPHKEISTVEDGAIITKQKRILEGYVFIRAPWSYQFYLTVSDSEYAFFLERPSRKDPTRLPSPVEQQELDKLRKTVEPLNPSDDLSVDAHIKQLDFKVGDEVKIKAGALAGMEGTVTAIFPKKQDIVVEVEVIIFSRLQKVETSPEGIQLRSDEDI